MTSFDLNYLLKPYLQIQSYWGLKLQYRNWVENEGGGVNKVKVEDWWYRALQTIVKAWAGFLWNSLYKGIFVILNSIRPYNFSSHSFWIFFSNWNGKRQNYEDTRVESQMSALNTGFEYNWNNLSELINWILYHKPWN